MKQKKILAVILGLALIFAFTACGGGDEGSDRDDSPAAAAQNGSSGTASSGADADNDSKDQSEDYGPLLKDLKKAKLYEGKLTTGKVGDTMKNSFFHWKVNSVRTKTKLDGKSAGAGKKFVVVNISVKNATKESFITGNYDFIGYMEASEAGHLDTEDSFYDDMYPDETDLAAGKTLTGDLVFLVDSDVDEIVVDYIEFYGDESIGNTNWVDLRL